MSVLKTFTILLFTDRGGPEETRPAHGYRPQRAGAHPSPGEHAHSFSVFLKQLQLLCRFKNHILSPAVL